jgi:hypothetical protein
MQLLLKQLLHRQQLLKQLLLREQLRELVLLDPLPPLELLEQPPPLLEQLEPSLLPLEQLEKLDPLLLLVELELVDLLLRWWSSYAAKSKKEMSEVLCVYTYSLA